MLLKVLMLAVCSTSVTHELALHEASYLIVREVMDSIPAEDSYIFYIPRLCHVDQFTFHI